VPGTVTDQALPLTTGLKVNNTVLALLTIVIVAICPSATPVVVPWMENPAAASAALTILSLAIGVVMAIEGAAGLTVSAWLA